MLIPYTVFGDKFLVPTRSLMKIFHCQTFLHNAFHVRVVQRIPKLILLTKLNVYTHINLMNKGLSIAHKLHVRCDPS